MLELATFVARATRLVECATASRQMIATAESCTGGLITGVLTAVPGSSEVLERGFVTYSDAAKVEMLGVDVTTLDRFGAVSAETAAEMARGALARSRADIAVSVTGIAGPGGGSADKPVGTVWIGWKRRGGYARAELFHFDGDRDAVRRQTVAAALRGVDGLLS